MRRKRALTCQPPGTGTMRRFTIILAVLIAAAGAIWFGVWTIIAGRIDGAVATGLADAADQGFSLSCDSQEIAGFPLRFDVICGKIGATDTASGLHAAMAGLRTATPVYWPWQSRAHLAAPLRLTGGPLPAPVDVTWSKAAINLDTATPVPERIAFAAEDLQAAFGEIAITAASTQAEASPTADRLGAAVSLTAAASRLLWQGRQTNAADIMAKARIDAPPEELLRGQFDPRRSGLSVRDLTVRLAADNAIVHIYGPVRFDRSGVLSGDLVLKVTGAESLPGLIASLPAAVQPAANAFFGGLIALAAPARLEGRQARALNVRIEGGVVRMGPLAVAHIPPLF